MRGASAPGAMHMAEVRDFMLKADRKQKAAAFEKRRLAWEKTRGRGKAYFVLVESALGPGGSVFLFLFCWGAFLYWLGEFHGDFWARVIAGGALYFALAILFGFWEWRSNEKRYHGKSTHQGSIQNAAEGSLDC